MLDSFRATLLTLAMIAASATLVAAQETGTPAFNAPSRGFKTDEFGAWLSDPGGGVSFALEGFYRYASGDNDLSLRGGLADLKGRGGTRLLLGGDFRAQVLRYSEAFPLDGGLTVGLGASLGDGPDAYYVPVGISLGRRLDVEGSTTSFLPYVHPVLVPRFGGGESEVDFALGLGVDVSFGPALAVRVSGGLGDINGVGIGLAFTR